MGLDPEDLVDDPVEDSLGDIVCEDVPEHGKVRERLEPKDFDKIFPKYDSHLEPVNTVHKVVRELHLQGDGRVLQVYELEEEVRHPRLLLMVLFLYSVISSKS